MSITSSLFSGISGLNALSNAMTVIGDNIANVNTVGFKGSRVTFQDVLSQTIGTTSGNAQVGRGTSLADVSGNFAQGSFESTESATDLAIGGEGFFIVRDPNDENNEYFTRAGEFRFDKDGNFVNPAGSIVRGWELDAASGQDKGTIDDVTLSSFTSSPDDTGKLRMIVNMDSTSTDNSVGANALSGNWDGSDADGDGNYIAENRFEYQTTLKVYDSLGSTHDVTIYFDKGIPVAAGQNPTWEYIVTCNPLEDKRTTVTDNTQLGLLARGTIKFNGSSGELSGEADSITCTLNDGVAADPWTNVLDNNDATATGGYFSFAPEFIAGSPMGVKLDFGTQLSGGIWANDALATTQYATPSTTAFQSADGYGAGDLQSITVGTDGVITGQYSNGQVIPLFRAALAKFQNEQGLYKVGGNLFRATRLSGEPITGKPGTNGLGSISPNSLEQSNVDIATEFVKMIITQRGFQANSKVITVTDQMLADIINLKR